MKKIKWRSLLTGNSGEGKPIDDASADAWVEHLNKKYKGEIFHEAVAVIDIPPVQKDTFDHVKDDCYDCSDGDE